jgi:hypothetical protein
MREGYGGGDEMELRSKMFARVCLGDLQKIVQEVREMELWAQELNEDIEDIADDIEDIEDLLFEICQYFNDCTRCPLKFSCKFAQEGCEEVFLCENCPRVRICVEKGSKGLYIYLRDSKIENGGDE